MTKSVLIGVKMTPYYADWIDKLRQTERGTVSRGEFLRNIFENWLEVYLQTERPREIASKEGVGKE